jgi:tRNA dimethylallyltransferase
MNNELVVISGPTGVGKTALGINIASEIGTEIISADSRQLYKEMSIGTAVPTKEQLSKVKHHFIQNLSVKDYYNASMYEQDVIRLLDDLFKKYQKVILLGGTGLYIDAVIKGIDELPEADLELRKYLQKRLEVEGLESLRKELKVLDPVSYHKVDLKNPKRVQKALEISLMTGKPYSSFLNNPVKKRPFSIKLIALNMERQMLYERINMRAEQMLEEGWLDEVRQLYSFRNENALKTVGYRELLSYIDGFVTLEEALEKIKANTRKYARKQITWFRKNRDYRWYTPDDEVEILKYINNG